MSSRATRAAALQALSARRKGHALPTSDSDDDGRIYDEVTEAEYSSYVRGRVLADTFIDDDDGSGYVDHGQDEWGSDRDGDGDGGDGDDSDQEYRRHFGISKKKGKKHLPQPGDYFGSAATKPKSSTRSARTRPQAPAVRGRSLFGQAPAAQRSKQDEEEFMANILNGLDAPGQDESPASIIRPMQGQKRPRPTDASSGSFGGFERFRSARRNAPVSPSSSATSANMPSSDPMVASPAKDKPAPRVRIMQPVPSAGDDELSWLSEAPTPVPPRQPANKRAKTQAAAAAAAAVPAALDVVAAAIQPQISPFDEEDSEDEGVRAAMPQGKFERLTAQSSSIPAAAARKPPETPPAPQPAAATTADPAPGAPAKLNIDWRQIHEALLMDDDDWEKELMEEDAALDAQARVKSARARSPSPVRGPKDPLTEVELDNRDAKVRETYYQPDGGVYFYWLDHYEQGDQIHLIGKIRNKSTQQWESCCVTVEGMERCLYVLPRQDPAHQDLESARKIREDKLARRAKKRRGENVEDMEIDEEDEQPWQEEVFDEFDALRSKFGIKTFLSSWVLRDYAFELPDVPRQSRYLKVRYGFDETQLPYDMTSETIATALEKDVDDVKIARIFGTGASAFELFLLKRRIMGPCWLRLDDATPRAIRNQPVHAGDEVVSWCQSEFSVDEPKSVSVVTSSMPDAPSGTPPLKIMSLSVRTVVNFKANQREVVCASARTWADYALEDDKPLNGKFDDRPFDKRPCTVTSFVRPIGPAFPPGFEKLAARQRSKTVAINYERSLLNALLAHIQGQDPDVIVGHDMIGVSLDVLLHRLRELKADQWSRVGRIRRRAWPQLTANAAVYVMAGRLLMDLSSDCGKSMIASTSWSLTEMASTHLGILRDELDPEETAGAFLDAGKVCLLLAHNEMDTWLCMAIAAKLQVLALTKQLTNIAGNSWNRTLNGGRAERNEYILLHDFYEKKYVLPDKITGRERMHARRIREKYDVPVPKAVVSSKPKRDKFKGGLVFEPKRGLCDKYVLVMDFNSLYPSIIQEFNIDFTTVERTKDEDTTKAVEAAGAEAGHGEEGAAAAVALEDVPEVPSSDVERGVLPALIATLVDKRRAVKGLMKDKRATKAQLAQWNVKQLALKLTANSMYGCLGFENSRFYARPLAALTTFKGREILRQTRELAESIALEVIYGDTDSVMINTNKVTFEEAMQIGREFKKSVNKHYRLLEIDIDAVFERMLLLQKKKYAALKVEDDGSRTKEIKGLDMKRREYCQLSKDASSYVLSQILSGEATETVVGEIHEYLRTLATEVREGRKTLDSFIIYKRLGKNPEDYPDAKSQPHVQVALRMKKAGGSARSGDVIPYIFTLPEGEEASTKSAQASRAHHPDELRKDGSELKIDLEYYLSLQVLPPIERLCDSIEGTDRARLAECLGLDVRRYTQANARDESAAQGGAFAPLDSQLTPEQRYAKCDRLRFRCPSCNMLTQFDGLLSALAKDQLVAGPAVAAAPPASVGLCCSGCRRTLGLPILAVQLNKLMSRHINRYYQGWRVCTDSACGLRCRLPGVYMMRCRAAGCPGTTVEEYNDKDLYTQLSYYQHLFDLDAAAAAPEAQALPGALLQLRMRHARLAKCLYTTADRMLARSARRYVDLGSLFAGIALSGAGAPKRPHGVSFAA